MAEAIFDGLGPVLTRWTMGGGAAMLAPSEWHADLGGDPAEAELRLLALSGQFLGTLVTAEPQGELHALPDVPKLAMPPLPDTLRPLARRILEGLRETRWRRDLLALLAARGWVLHPGDWMPAANDEDSPDVYAPWRDWAAGAAATDTARHAPEDSLTAETWDDYWPAARGVALSQLRRRDPAAATALFAARFGGENADARLRLLGLLATGLSDADRPFLESLAGDRAPKVKALAAALLARLGHGPALGEEATELAGFFELRTKGLLRRTRVIGVHPLKTTAQRTRRYTLFGAVDLGAFAAALGFAPDELVATWPWGEDPQADHGLIDMVERTGTDDLVAALCTLLGGAVRLDVSGILTLQPRLNTGQRDQLARQVLRATGGTFHTALGIVGGGAAIDGAIDTTAGAALLTALGSAEDAARRADLIAEIQALGLIASRTAAQAAIERLGRTGLLAADPRLDLLRLNAALDDALKDRGTG
jgi:hypothetical protein